MTLEYNCRCYVWSLRCSIYYNHRTRATRLSVNKRITLIWDLPVSVYLSVCLSVCLSVRQITQKVVNGFWWNVWKSGRGPRTDRLNFVIVTRITISSWESFKKNLYPRFLWRNKNQTWNPGRRFKLSECLLVTAAVRYKTVVIRGGSSPKILGALPPSLSSVITESVFSVLRNRKKYELHRGLHLKSIISRVANSVIG